MVARTVSRFALLVVLALLASAAFAQTEYDIPDGTNVDYIYYGVTPPYTNTFLSDIPMGLYTVDLTIHFTEGNPAATYGSITFVRYDLPGSPAFTETLTNINYSPFSLKTATATAAFAGTLNGSLTLNIQQFVRPHCFRYCQYDALTTVNGVHSNFTLDAPQASVHSLYRCGSDRRECLIADGTGPQCPHGLPNCKP